MTQRRNRLRPENYEALERWARGQKTKLRGWTWGAIAEAATRDLGFFVSAGNIRGLGIDWGRGPGAPRTKPDLGAVVERIRQDVSRIARRVGVKLSEEA